ncbi:MAG TPA: hypothetical protein VKV35_14265 [Streptosporangiaceae bacterium]|nr:hypothetical protein [Streptosporangiaceae bacterium]
MSRDFSERQWLATVVLIGCAGLAALALAAEPYPHELAQRLPRGLSGKRRSRSSGPGNASPAPPIPPDRFDHTCDSISEHRE